MNRRTFLQSTAAGAVALSSGCATVPRAAARRPNVLIIITDDQGYGDLACHGNPHLRTPHLDRLHDESARLTNFYVSPVCSPTRASLMTGRYNYRTGVVDTYLGRSMMHADEVTLPERLREAGYRTGIFGKWHLGDNYPLRAMDQGFEEALVHNGGGVGQPSDPPGNTYFDPELHHNGHLKRYNGYCTDIFASAAIDFIRAHQDESFFTYLSTNAPHTPLQVPEEAVAPYRAMGLDERTAKIYGMIENIDSNVGRVLATLEELGLAQDTLVWFLTDNGSQFGDNPPRHTAGMRGAKGTVYEAGIHVPSFVRYPRGWEGNRELPEIAAHIDMMPTLLDLCGVALPEDRAIDGRSLLPLFKGTAQQWPERELFFQWHRGDVPEPFRACAVRDPQYKLVDGKELYDLWADPGESQDIAVQQPEVVARLREAYENWFAEMEAGRHFAPPRIGLGGPENPVMLSSQDWRGSEVWGAAKQAYWEVEILEAGTYEVSLHFIDRQVSGQGKVLIGSQAAAYTPNPPSSTWYLPQLQLEKGPCRLAFKVETNEDVNGVRYVGVRKW